MKIFNQKNKIKAVQTLYAKLGAESLTIYQNSFYCHLRETQIKGKLKLLRSVHVTKGTVTVS